MDPASLVIRPASLSVALICSRSSCLVHYRIYRDKLSGKSLEGRLVGYSKARRAYRIYDPASREVIGKPQRHKQTSDAALAAAGISVNTDNSFDAVRSVRLHLPSRTAIHRGKIRRTTFVGNGKHNPDGEPWKKTVTTATSTPLSAASAR